MKHVDHIVNERTVLQYLTLLNIKANKDKEYSKNGGPPDNGDSFEACPFIVQFISSFQDMEHLYFELEYVSGCSLLSQIRKANPVIQQHYLFYAQEVLLTLQYLSRQGVIYRDLKPENICLSMSHKGHVKLVDFGFAKILSRLDARTETNCGTPAYIAPEILKSIPYGFEVDVWSFGVLLVEIVSGQTPFYSEDTKGIYEKVTKCQPNYNGLIPPTLRDLLDKIFVLDQENRIKYNQIKKHALFHELDWSKSMSEIFHEMTAPFLPKEEDFNEKPIRASTEKKKGFAAFLKDTGGGQQDQNMIFDEDHFNKFLKEDVENREESSPSNQKHNSKALGQSNQ